GIAKRMKMTFSAEQMKAYTTIGGTPHLDNDYTVFGEIVEGMEVIDKIKEDLKKNLILQVLVCMADTTSKGN
ncbi:MAG: peptidylprolyl isomerase, partial [Bacteroidetes bacterium]|nr:peptidylprolyl isomerase [Bacteroidota bacterium]